MFCSISQGRVKKGSVHVEGIRMITVASVSVMVRLNPLFMFICTLCRRGFVHPGDAVPEE
jgi:hypothetical protein